VLFEKKPYLQEIQKCLKFSKTKPHSINSLTIEDSAKAGG